MVVEADGVLGPARDRLTAAVGALTAATVDWVDGRVRSGPSLYVQLCREKAPSLGGALAGGSEGRRFASSRPSAHIDALVLSMNIDDTVRDWSPKGGGTVARLQGLAEHGWRPQDVRLIEDIAGRVESWVAEIKSLLDPSPRFGLPAACPACAVRTVRRRNDVGEMVRQAALQIGPEGCTCQACRHTWPPGQYVFLARLLGFDPPEGVVA
ncbi:DUF7341 domain-containing protein [Mycolicibacillus trivialis]|nr:hypothetical protein [Mycolicibacillus trivialis]